MWPPGRSNAAVHDVLNGRCGERPIQKFDDIDGMFSGLPPAPVRDELGNSPLQHPPLAHRMGRAF